MNFSIFVSKIFHKNLLTIIIWLRGKTKKKHFIIIYNNNSKNNNKETRQDESRVRIFSLVLWLWWWFFMFNKIQTQNYSDTYYNTYIFAKFYWTRLCIQYDTILNVSYLLLCLVTIPGHASHPITMYSNIHR